MGFLFTILAILAGLAGFGCWLLILIDAFQDQIWKGFVGLLCWFYLLYYALFEFEHEYKWTIVIGGFAGNAIAGGLYAMGHGR